LDHEVHTGIFVKCCLAVDMGLISFALCLVHYILNNSRISQLDLRKKFQIVKFEETE
jgi:hypothetical protein